MNLEYLTQLLGNRLSALNTAKDQAFLTGDLERINIVDAEINGVIDTLNKLKLLQGISETALATPFTEAEVVQNGIEASFEGSKTKIIFDGDLKGCLLGYDISSYATDPLHEEKIADILGYIGVMSSPSEIDAYINSEAIGSPVTGQMILNAGQKYNVDVRLMMALMELDSRFGTAGVAIRTLNPGNVGNNDDGDTRTYPTWDAGVEAVAKWLDNHRIEAETKIVEELKQEEEPEPEAEIEPEEEEPEPEPEIEPEPESEIIPEPNPEPIPEPEPEVEPVLPVIETEPEIITEPVSEPVVSVIKRKRRVI